MPSTKPVNYIADRADLHKLSTAVKKDVAKVDYSSPFASTGEKVTEKLKNVTNPDVAAYQAHYAPYINKPANETTDNVVKSLTNPRENA